jgi:hypothetical protein
MVKILWSDAIILVSKGGSTKTSKFLLYDIFILTFPKTWNVNKFKSFFFSLYENFILTVLILISSFVLFFFFFLNDYWLFCSELATSLIDPLYKDKGEDFSFQYRKGSLSYYLFFGSHMFYK